MKITPIALQKIVDRISDGYIVINEEDIIIDYNKTFLDMFKLEKFLSEIKTSLILLQNLVTLILIKMN